MAWIDILKIMDSAIDRVRNKPREFRWIVEGYNRPLIIHYINDPSVIKILRENESDVNQMNNLELKNFLEKDLGIEPSQEVLDNMANRWGLEQVGQITWRYER